MDVVIAVERDTRTGEYGWAVLYGADRKAVPAVTTGFGWESAAYEQVVAEAVATLTSMFGGLPLRVYSTFDGVLARLGSATEQLWVVCSRHESSLHPWRHDALRYVREQMTHVMRTRPTSVGLVAAADGSWSRRSHLGGLGVVFADGRWVAQPVTRSPSPLLAELRAIATALKLAQGVPLQLMTDSREALNVLKNPPAALSKTQFKSVRHIRRLLRASPETVLRKVKAHSGIALHDGADELAVAARRHHEAAVVDDELRDGVYVRIVNDAVTRHHASTAASGPYRLAAGPTLQG